MRKEQISRVLIDSFTATPGTTKSVNLNGLQVTRGGMRGYVLAMHVIVTSLAKESSAAAACSYLNIWKLLSSVTVRAAGFTLLDAVNGFVLYHLGLLYGYIRPQNGDAYKLADIGTSASDVACNAMWTIPFAPYFLTKKNAQREHDGAMPLVALASGGELTIGFAAATILGGNWSVTGDVTVKVVADVLWTHKAKIPGAHKIEVLDSANSRVEMSRENAKWESLCVMDDAYASYTLPTSAFSAECDGVRVCEGLTGLEMQKVLNPGIEDGFDDIETTGFLPVIIPQDSASIYSKVSGAPLTIENANVSHAGNNKYVGSKFVDLPASSVETIRRLLGVTDAAAANPNNYEVRGKKVAGKKSANERMGATLTIVE